MTEFQKTNALLRDMLRLTYVQHQFFIWALSPDHYGAWLNRFALGFYLQKKHKIWNEEEWKIIAEKDLRDAFKRWPQLKTTRKKLSKYYPADVRSFMKGVIASVGKTSTKRTRK